MDTLRARVCLYVICRSGGGDSRREKLALPMLVVVEVVVVVAGFSVNSSVRAFSTLFFFFSVSRHREHHGAIGSL